MVRKISLGLSLLSLFISAGLRAQTGKDSTYSIDMYFPSIVVTANRYEKNAFETHVPVNIIRKQEIWQRGSVQVGELVERVAGATSTSMGPWSQKIVLRGLAGAHVLTLVDGMRLDVLRSYGNHAPIIDVDQIDRVEIIRGPASVLYGSEAVAGVVNLITKKPPFNQSGVRVEGELGLLYSTANQQVAENLILSISAPHWSFALGLNHRRANDVDTPMGRLANSGFRGYSVDAKLGFKPGEKHRFLFMTQYHRFQDVGVPTDPYALDAEFRKYDRDVVALIYEFRSPEARWTGSKINLFYQWGARNFYAFISRKPKGQLFVNQALNADRKVKNYGMNLQNSFTLLSNNLLTFGADIFGEFDDTRRIADSEIVDSQGNIVKNPPPDLAPPTPESDRQGIGLFIEDEFLPWSAWTFTLGVRYDYLCSRANGTPGTLVSLDRTEADRNVSGNLGALYRLSRNIHFMANIGRAFKAPTLQERFFMGTAQVGYLYGNPELESETSLNLDAGMKWDLGFLHGEVAVFRNHVDDFIIMKPVSTMADTFLYDNVGKALISGLEIQSELRPFPQFTVFLNASYARGQDIESDEPLPKIPPIEGVLGLRYESRKRQLWLEINGRFVGEQNRVADNELSTQGYRLFNLSSGIDLGALLKIKHPLLLTLNIRNLFDESYRDHLSYISWWDAAGRNIILGLRSEW